MNSDFAETEDGFLDDDISPEELNGLKLGEDPNVVSRSFLESDNFEHELGSSADDPFSEDFSEIQRHEIINIIGEGDLVGRPILVLYAYRLPSNKTFDHQKFLRYLQKTLDKLVELDYSIVYFHYGLRSHNKPPIKWLLQAYQLLDRNYKKNLKALFIVHPTRFIKIVWKLFQPFISAKFAQKIQYVTHLDELNSSVRVPSLNLPQPIVDHDETVRLSSSLRLQTNSNAAQTPSQQFRPTQQFDVSLEFILNHNPNCDLPPIVTELLEFLRQHGLNTEGIFRKSAEISIIRTLQARINKGDKVDFINEPQYKDRIQKAVIDASVLLKTFLRSMGEPVITNRLYPELIKLSDATKQEKPALIREFLRKLPAENYVLLKILNKFLTEVAANSSVNLMDANNLSVVFGPNLTWPTNQQVPITQLNNLNNFCYTLISNYDQIFES